MVSCRWQGTWKARGVFWEALVGVAGVLLEAVVAWKERAVSGEEVEAKRRAQGIAARTLVA